MSFGFSVWLSEPEPVLFSFNCLRQSSPFQQNNRRVSTFFSPLSSRCDLWTSWPNPQIFFCLWFEFWRLKTSWDKVLTARSIWRWALTREHKQTDQNTNGWLGLLFWWFWHEETTETDRWNKVIWYLDLRRGLDYHDLILLLHIQVCDVFIMLWYETKRKWRPMKQRHLKQLFIKAFPFVHISLCRCSSASILTEERSRVELWGRKSLKRSFRQKNLVLQPQQKSDQCEFYFTGSEPFHTASENLDV